MKPPRRLTPHERAALRRGLDLASLAIAFNQILHTAHKGMNPQRLRRTLKQIRQNL